MKDLYLCQQFFDELQIRPLPIPSVVENTANPRQHLFQKMAYCKFDLNPSDITLALLTPTAKKER